MNVILFAYAQEFAKKGYNSDLTGFKIQLKENDRYTLVSVTLTNRGDFVSAQSVIEKPYGTTEQIQIEYAAPAFLILQREMKGKTNGQGNAS